MKTPFVLAVGLLVTSFFTSCDRRPRAGDVVDSTADQRRVEDLRVAERNASEREAAARDAERDLARSKAEQRSAELARENAALAARAREAEETAEKSRAAAESAQRNADAAKTEQTLDFFYDALAPHGDWIEVADYGYAWRPRAVAELRWRPYLDGHWAWTEFGWTWISNEPFGWATYHYGRWTRLKRLGWVWIPGSEWAPAWVAWRSSDRFVGWAPLPPEAHSGSGFTAAVDNYYDIGPSMYAFVPVEEFGDATYVGKVEEPSENITIVNQTVNVTNITYKNVENKTVVHNDGPALNIISRRSKNPVRTLKVERAENAVATSETDNVLRLRAPNIRAASKPAGAPKQVKEQARRDDVDRGWEGADPAHAKKAREQQSREARAAEAAQVAQGAQGAGPRETPRTPPAQAEPAVEPARKPAPQIVPEKTTTAPPSITAEPTRDPARAKKPRDEKNRALRATPAPNSPPTEVAPGAVADE
jgi:hypothetical protein